MSQLNSRSFKAVSSKKNIELKIKAKNGLNCISDHLKCVPNVPRSRPYRIELPSLTSSLDHSK